MTAEHFEADPLPGPAAASAALEPGAAARPAIGVLASRLAAALVHHEPGWRLPRHTALARRYSVRPAEIEAAIGELIGRNLVRRLADGQLYRASPTEYLIELEGVTGLSSILDPMGGELVCRSRQVSWRRVPEDVGWALGLGAADAVCVVRLLWTSGGEPAASATTYLPDRVVRPAGAEAGTVLPEPLSLLPSLGTPDGPGAGIASPAPRAPAAQPAALHIEMQPPPPGVARRLRLAAGLPATIITVRFDSPADARPAALTVAVLRSDQFRVALQSPRPRADGEDGSFPGGWTHAVEDWED